MTYLSILTDPSHYFSPFSFLNPNLEKKAQHLKTSEKVASIFSAILLGSFTYGVGGIIAFYLVSGYLKYRHLKSSPTLLRKKSDGTASPSIHQAHSVRIFSGDSQYKGVSWESCLALQKASQNVFKNSSCSPCQHEQVTPAYWNRQDLFIFPGGTCSEWDKLLSQEKQKELLNWITEGGRLLGVCAGGYYCSSQSEFQFNSNQKIARMRELSLFPGICRGPTYSSEPRVVRVRWEKTQKEGFVIVQGGGEFIPPNTLPDLSYEVLARYIDKPLEESIAVVECAKGNGKAILSGPHWEFNGEDLEVIKQGFPRLATAITEMQPLLESSIIFRKECLQEMFTRLTPNEN